MSTEACSRAKNVRKTIHNLAKQATVHAKIAESYALVSSRLRSNGKLTKRELNTLARALDSEFDASVGTTTDNIFELAVRDFNC